MKHTRTPLARLLGQAYRKALSGVKEETPTSEINPQAKKISRKDFFSNTVMAGAAITLPSVLQSCNTSAKGTENAVSQNISVAIIGAGIAGLNAAHLLNKQVGIKATIYEASKRTGGRMLSAQNLMAPGITTELGGEFIDSTHKDILDLIEEFKLEKMDCVKDVEENHLAEHTFFFGGKIRSNAEVDLEFSKYAKKIQADKNKLDGGDETRIAELDKLSMKQYLNQLGLSSGWFYDLLYYGYTAEFGLYPDDFGCLNFIDLVGIDISDKDAKCDKFQIFGDSDERYKVRGGNQLITDKLTEVVKDQIKFEHKLESIKKEGNKYVLGFNTGEVKADYVLIAIPFTVLRNVKIDDSVNLPAIKKQMIAEFGYGQNSKLMMGAKERIWRNDGSSGYVMNNVVQNGWDNSQLQGGNKGPGGYSVLLGGNEGLNLENNEATVDKYLTEVAKVFKGAKENYTGKSSVMNWNTQEFAKGSYSCYKVGQWTTFKGRFMEPVGNLFFAGEHCSEEFYGFMNGGAETGRLAVGFMTTNILRDILSQKQVAQPSA